jgi:hypothetical protein
MEQAERPAANGGQSDQVERGAQLAAPPLLPAQKAKRRV